MRYTIDPSHSSAEFSVRHLMITNVKGRFGKLAGTVELDTEHPETSVVDVTIDATSIDTREEKRDAHLRSPDFFDVERFPELRFQSSRIEKTGSDRYRVLGNLTIRDVTREVTLDAEYAGRGTDPWGNERVAFAAKTTIDRKDFGLGWNQVLEAGGVLVGDRVEIELDVQVVKAAATQAA
jgi:polyisoprenoid-binding protein YceI